MKTLVGLVNNVNVLSYCKHPEDNEHLDTAIPTRFIRSNSFQLHKDL